MTSKTKITSPKVAALGEAVLKPLRYHILLPIKYQTQLTDKLRDKVRLWALRSIEQEYAGSNHPYASQICNGVLTIRRILNND